jgi:hypothetical protein
MHNVLVYVAGPIGKGDLVHNIKLAHDAGMALLRAKIPCIVPHGSCFWGSRVKSVSGPPHYDMAFVAEITPEGTTLGDWYGMDLVIVSRCDAVLRLPGESVGADLEVTLAREQGKPVFYSVADVVEWATGRG